MKSVNLEEILLVCVAKSVVEFDESNEAHMKIGKELLEEVKKTANFKVIIEAMKIACEQTVDLCSENARSNEIAEGTGGLAFVDKQSIITIKNFIIAPLF